MLAHLESPTGAKGRRAGAGFVRGNAGRVSSFFSPLCSTLNAEATDLRREITSSGCQHATPGLLNWGVSYLHAWLADKGDIIMCH